VKTAGKLFQFLRGLALDRFFGTVTIKFEHGKVTHVEAETRRAWQYKVFPASQQPAKSAIWLAGSADDGEERRMITRQELLNRREAILDIARRHGAHDVRVIGSIARGDADEASDLDLVVRFDPDRTLLDHGELIMDLRDLLEVDVDVISEAGMRDRFRRHVMKEAIAL